MNAAFESIFKRSLSASASVNLRLNDNIDIAQFASDLLRFIQHCCDFATCRRYIELLQQFPGLIFVNVHPLSAWQTVQLACDHECSNGFLRTGTRRAIPSVPPRKEFQPCVALLAARVSQRISETARRKPQDGVSNTGRFPVQQCNVEEVRASPPKAACPSGHKHNENGLSRTPSKIDT